MTILVTGATGNIGSRVLTTLLAAGQQVRGSGRTSGGPRLPTGATAVELDLTDPRKAEVTLHGVDAVFLYPVRGDITRFLRIAQEAGVGYVLLLSSPAAYEAGEHDRPIGLAHRAVERSLAESELPHTVLYPSWLASNAQRDWGERIRTTGRVGIAYPDARVNPIHLDDVAEVAAALLTRDDQRARMQVLTGPESLRQREIVEILGEVRDRPIELDRLTRQQALAQWPPWLPEPILAALLDAEAAAVDIPAVVTNTVERITGHPARNFHSWATEHCGEFQPAAVEG